MDHNTKVKLYKLNKTIENSKEKIDRLKVQLKTSKDAKTRGILERKIEIEKIRILMKQKEGKLIVFMNK